MSRSRVRSRQAGMAMMLVLWVLAVLTIMAGAFALSTRRTLDQSQLSQLSARSLALAEGGVHYAMFMLTHPDPRQRWRSDGRSYPLRLPTGEVLIRVGDEGGRMDINAMQEATLRAFFGAVLGDERLAGQLADAILDWRDQDDLKRLNGAEIGDYRAARRTPLPQNRPFVMPEELLGVFGMTPEIYAQVEPLITVWSGQDGVDPQRASPDLLRIVFRGDEKLVMQVLEARARSVEGQETPVAVPPPPGIRFATAAGTAYRVSVDTLIDGEPGLGVEAVLRRAGMTPGKPFATASWKVLTAAAGAPPAPRDALGYR